MDGAPAKLLGIAEGRGAKGKMPAFSGTRAVLSWNLGCQEIGEHTFLMTDSIGFRVYSDAKPNIWRTADLQKGLILVYNGKEEVGEGTGFGVPVIMTSGETYFSGSARVYLRETRQSVFIKKEYCMDLLARNAYRNVRLENSRLRSMLKRVSELYQRNRRWRSAILTLKEIAMKIGVDSSFVKTVSIGRVVVSYKIYQNRILVEADFTHVKQLRLEKIFMMNEQGTEFFKRYLDSSGERLADEQIGAWDQVTTDWAEIMNSKCNIGFRLRRIEGSLLRVGREFQDGHLDWVGLDYQVEPRNKTFRYEIEILGV